MSRRGLGALFVVGAAFVACKFSPATAPSDGSSDALTDAAPEECTESSKRCLDADTLRTCPAANEQSFDTPCAWGCVEAGEAHCGLIAPAGSGVGQVDVDPATAFTGLGDVMLVGDVDGDTGEIAGAATPDGVHYEIKNNMAVFRARRLTIPAASGGVKVIGTRPVIFIADEAITVADAISAVGCGGGSGTAPGPGGFAGGNTAAAPGAGPGSGAGATAGSDDGGGGAGHGAAGGAGAGADAGMGGLPFGMDTIPVLQGGAGGGAGDGGGNFGRGGGGGGALQLISNTAIVIATGGVIHAGGCGGSRGGGGSDGGGGGGAGGTILLEAPAVTIAGTLAVNGGGGGGGGGGGAGSGSAGQPSRTAANGGTADANRTGGLGGVGGTAGGAGGAANTVADIGGGGGGGVGRIRVNSKPGAMATVMAGSVMSPSFEDAGTTATQGAADIR